MSAELPVQHPPFMELDTASGANRETLEFQSLIKNEGILGDPDGRKMDRLKNMQNHQPPNGIPLESDLCIDDFFTEHSEKEQSY